MLRYLPLIFLFAACAGDPLAVEIIDSPTTTTSEVDLTEILYESDGPLRGTKELLPDHKDLTLKLSFRVEEGTNATLNLQGKYPIALPEVSTSGGDPIIPAKASDGIWHDLEVVFLAATENTPPIFSAVYLDDNLVYYQQELIPVEGPAGPLTVTVHSGGLELSNLRQAPISGRTSGLDDKGEIDLNIPLLRYEFYDIEPGTKDVRDWAQRSPTKTGYINRFDLDNILAGSKRYALRFYGQLDIPSPGEYRFHDFTPLLGRVYIDDNLLLDHGQPGAGRSVSKSVELAEGVHEVRVELIQPGGGWNRFNLNYVAPGQKSRLLNSMAGDKAIATPGASTPMVIETEQIPYLLRSFLYFPKPKVYEEASKRTHVISVGELNGPHYSLDLQTGALLQVWQGEFADVYDMWNGRGEPQVMRPLGPALTFAGSPQWATSATNPWPLHPEQPDEDDFQHDYHELDNVGRPTFVYTFKDSSVSDKLEPRGVGVLRRELTNSGTSKYTLVAAARQITETAPGEFELQGPGMRLKIESYDGSGLTLQRNGNQQHLIAEIPTAGHIRYSLSW
ncbi:MAG: PA14 domain-containing protein [Bacteroidota bacterium]